MSGHHNISGAPSATERAATDQPPPGATVWTLRHFPADLGRDLSLPFDECPLPTLSRRPERLLCGEVPQTAIDSWRTSPSLGAPVRITKAAKEPPKEHDRGPPEGDCLLPQPPLRKLERPRDE